MASIMAAGSAISTSARPFHLPRSQAVYRTSGLKSVSFISQKKSFSPIRLQPSSSHLRVSSAVVTLLIKVLLAPRLLVGRPSTMAKPTALIPPMKPLSRPYAASLASEFTAVNRKENRRVKYHGLEEDIADDRLQFWIEQNNHYPTPHDAVEVERGLFELKKFGLESQLWTASRREIDKETSNCVSPTESDH